MTWKADSVARVFAAIAKFKSSNFSPELRDQMEDAAAATQKAFANLRRIVYMETGDGPPTAMLPMAVIDEVFGDKSKDKDRTLSSEVLIMQPIFRFFQLLCENHNLELQVNHWHTHAQLFYGCLDFVRNNPGEPVPEETLTQCVVQDLNCWNHFHASTFMQSVLSVFFVQF